MSHVLCQLQTVSPCRWDESRPLHATNESENESVTHKTSLEKRVCNRQNESETATNESENYNPGVIFAAFVVDCVISSSMQAHQCVVKSLPWTQLVEEPKSFCEFLGLKKERVKGWSADAKGRFDLLAFVGKIERKTVWFSHVKELVRDVSKLRFVPDDFFISLHKEVNALGVLKLRLVDPSEYLNQLKHFGDSGVEYDIDVARAKEVECYTLQEDGYFKTQDKIMLMPLMLKIFLAGPEYEPKNRCVYA